MHFMQFQSGVVKLYQKSRKNNLTVNDEIQQHYQYHIKLSIPQRL